MTASQKEQTQPGGAGSQGARGEAVAMNKDTPDGVDLEQARQHLEMLDDPGARFHFRMIPDRPADRAMHSAHNESGTFDDVADLLVNANAAGYGIFVVVNDGGHKDNAITRVRAVHADFDTPDSVASLRVDALRLAGIEPHLVVESSAGKYHAYWKVTDLPPHEFEAVQADVIARFGSDKSVKNLSRVMRLAGFFHRKPADATHDGVPFRSEIVYRSFHPSFTGAQAKAKFRRESVSLGEALAAIGPASRDVPTSLSFSPTRQFDYGGGVTVYSDRHTDLLQVAARLARQVVFEGLARASALLALNAERDRGRWTREMPDDEVERALDGAIEKCRSGQWTALLPAANEELSFAPTLLSEALAREITPFTEEDFAIAAKPHPHVFDDGRTGIFPIREVTVIAAPGREGKTFGVVYMASQAVLGRSVGGLAARRCRSIIYSNEDDRQQYARKVLALGTRLSQKDRDRLRHGLLVPDLEVPGLIDARQIVAISEKRRPVPAAMVDALIAAVRPMCDGDDPVRLMIFETASTLSDADEDNPGLKTLVAALKRIARELGVAVVLVHHTSQAAQENLPGLKLSVADIRGGTALAYNARQCFLLVNLGSDEDSFGDKDMRTHVRRHVAPLSSSRMSALICLDTSKAADPPPIFLSWVVTEYGPAMFEEALSSDIAGASWRKTRNTITAKVIGDRDKAKAGKSSDDVALCIDAAKKLDAEGKAPTVRAVSFALGRGADWAKPRLDAAVGAGDLVRKRERVPNCADECHVYRPAKREGQVVGSDAPADGLRFSADYQGSNSSEGAD